MNKWKSVKSELPKKWGLYLVCAKSADKNKPFRHLAFYSPETGWEGLVEVWLNALEYWMEFPETPYKNK